MNRGRNVQRRLGDTLAWNRTSPVSASHHNYRSDKPGADDGHSAIAKALRGC